MEEPVCELLPILLSGGRLWFLEFFDPWLVPLIQGEHPSCTVMEHIQTFFGDQFSPLVLHSTSWRYVNRLVLTYLIVMPEGTWITSWIRNGQLTLLPIGQITQVYGTHVFPPATIGRDAALAHALDHLALLLHHDPAIRAQLSAAWMNVLADRLPQPAGELRKRIAS